MDFEFKDLAFWNWRFEAVLYSLFILSCVLPSMQLIPGWKSDSMSISCKLLVAHFVHMWSLLQAHWLFSLLYMRLRICITILSCFCSSVIWFLLLTERIYMLCAKMLQLCTTLCDPMNWSPLGSSVHGILQVRILEWVAMSSSRGSSQARDWILVSCIAGWSFTNWVTSWGGAKSAWLSFKAKLSLFCLARLFSFVSAFSSLIKFALWNSEKAKEAKAFL